MVAATKTKDTEPAVDEFVVLSHTFSGWDDPADKVNRQPHIWGRGEVVRLDPGAKRTAELVRLGAIRWVGAPVPSSRPVTRALTEFDATIDPA